MGIFDLFRRSAPPKKSSKMQTRRYRAPLDKTSPGGWMPAGGSVERAIKSQLRIDALTADLDALTGGWFSKQLAAKGR